MTDQTPAASPPPVRKRSWGKRLLITVVAVLVAGVALLGVAEHETAKPDFCGSCHIMEPYHESWQADLHGSKLDVACVDCHYAPGERTTVKAKLRGLSQVASYVSGRYGATRPRAHVSNDSCLASKCHGDGAFMDKELAIGSVNFQHANHLRLDPAVLEKVNKDLAELSAKIRTTVGEVSFGSIEAAAREAGPYRERIDRMVELAAASGATVERGDLVRLSDLNHRGVRIAQLDEIQCTNCHAYGARMTMDGHPAQAHHFSVATTTCYTCHFNNEGFNTGTNNCLMCHTELPQGEILVHRELTAEAGAQLETPELTTQTVKMNHAAILERKVDCKSCHADVASEDSLVTRRDCERCHDQPRFFEGWQEPFTVDQVAEYHKVHVSQQRAKCLDCHSEIHHQLIRDTDGDEPTFLTSVMANCAQCHPNHHLEQLALLRGTGAQGVAAGDPNLMFGARTNCVGCHTETMADEHSGDVAHATLSGCVACHGDQHSDTFEKWKLGLELFQGDAEQAYAAAQQALDESRELPEEARQRASELLAVAKADLRLIQRGNGVHNVTYAIEVLDSVTQRSKQAQAIVTEAQGTP